MPDVPGTDEPFSFNPETQPVPVEPTIEPQLQDAPQTPVAPQVPVAPTPPVEQPFQTAEPEPVEPQASPLLQSLQESGAQGIGTEEEAINYVRDMQARQAELEQQANFGRQVLPYAQDFQTYIQSRQEPPPAPVAEPEVPEWQKHEAEYWKRPEYDPTWENMVRVNPETGMYEGVNTYVPATVVQGMNNYRTWQQQSVRRLLDNPVDVVREGMKPWMQNFVQDQISAVMEEQQRQNEMQTIERELQGVIYDRDPVTGVPKIDPMTNNYVLNDYGQIYVQEMQKARAFGIEDPRAIQQIAENAVAAQIYYHQQQQPADPQPAPEEMPAPAPAQPEVAPQQPPVPQTQFLENAKRKSMHAPSLAGSFGNQQVTPDAAGISVESESFFTDSARAGGHIHQ